MNTVSPSEMMIILHSPYSESARAGLRWASLDMLKELYRETPNHPKVQEARLAMDIAISEWSSDQILDFLVNYLFEPPLSTEFRLKSSEELRQILQDVYHYLFL